MFDPESDAEEEPEQPNFTHTPEQRWVYSTQICEYWITNPGEVLHHRFSNMAAPNGNVNGILGPSLTESSTKTKVKVFFVCVSSFNLQLNDVIFPFYLCLYFESLLPLVLTRSRH